MRPKPNKIMALGLVWMLCVALLGCAAQPEETGAIENSGGQDAAGEGFFSFLDREQTYEVPAGTALTFELRETLSTESNEAGDTFRARLVEPIVLDGQTLIRAGADAMGRILELQESGRVEGRAAIRLVMDEVSDNGEDHRISTDGYYAVAEATTGEDAAKIGAGAGIGAVVGGIIGGGKGAATGAAIGGGGGTAVVLATKGEDIEMAEGTRISFVLNEPLEVSQ